MPEVAGIEPAGHLDHGVIDEEERNERQVELLRPGLVVIGGQPLPACRPRPRIFGNIGVSADAMRPPFPESWSSVFRQQAYLLYVNHCNRNDAGIAARGPQRYARPRLALRVAAQSVIAQKMTLMSSDGPNAGIAPTAVGRCR